jgi:hypothetical protein
MLFALNCFIEIVNKKRIARPITETPVLTGQDAVRLAKNPPKTTPEERQAMKDAYKQFKLMYKDPNIF